MSQAKRLHPKSQLRQADERRSSHMSSPEGLQKAEDILEGLLGSELGQSSLRAQRIIDCFLASESQHLLPESGGGQAENDTHKRHDLVLGMFASDARRRLTIEYRITSIFAEREVADICCHALDLVDSARMQSEIALDVDQAGAVPSSDLYDSSLQKAAFHDGSSAYHAQYSAAQFGTQTRPCL